ncbi:MAG: low specificity L-threonine aldolase, partial [Brevundimonas sp.]
MRYDFASDNTAGMAPEALEALAAANAGYARAYGTDDITRRAADL